MTDQNTEAFSGPRFVVGIDLGTSNTAVAFAPLSGLGNGQPAIEAFEINQLIRPGDLQNHALLPSAYYIPAEFEIQSSDLELPWTSDSEASTPLKPPYIVGKAARRLGAKTPIRLIESSKSWLCHGGVRRTANILPWHAPEEIPKCSPVDVATSLLNHIRGAWNHQMGEGDPLNHLEAQMVVLTVPASFDEVARRLTLEAAKHAGLTQVQLLEEPLAAFYAYIARTGGTPAMTGLQGGETILIADVGGGTTDFTLVKVSQDDPQDAQAPLKFSRTAVGEHLLLGGDNMDLALAHAVEPELSKGKRLDAEAWAQLKSECRNAKETLFSHPEHEKLPITITARGRKLLGGQLKAELHRHQLESVVLDGYFPALPGGQEARPETQRAGFSEYGLPYATDPRITRHLAQFLLEHASSGHGSIPHIDAILFNGGALKPVWIRDRILEVMGDWFRTTADSTDRPNPKPLIWDEGETALELSVARGATYFGLVKRGLGLRVHGGSPREYFLGLGPEPGESIPEDQRKVVCIAPRGMQDGQAIEVSEKEFQLITNRPVTFPLYSTTSARQDPVGSVLNLAANELHELLPLRTVIKFGKQKAGTKVPVRIQVRRTEIGTLELSCLSKMSGSRFKLEFDLRSGGTTTQTSTAHEGVLNRAPPESGDVQPEQLQKAIERLQKTFGLTLPRLVPAQLSKGLESDLDLKRDAFPLAALRTLAENLLDLMEQRTLSPEMEARWLNIIGFCLRPGFGVPLDDWRVKQLWRIHGPGAAHPNHPEVALNWWILWRRVAGGLNRGHQDELASRIFPLLIPAQAKRAKRKPPKPQSQEAAEIWRAAAALEHISAKQRTLLGNAMMDLLEAHKAPRGAIWCMSRIGSRRLLYGPRESIIKPNVVSGWLQRLYALSKWPKGEAPSSAIIALARRSGDRQLDISDEHRAAAIKYLKQSGVPDEHLQPLHTLVEMDHSTQTAAFGDSLPAGLSLT